jgi:hypothetical protein
MIASLLAAEEALLWGSRAPTQRDDQISLDQPLRWSDVPSNAHFSDVIELECSLQEIVETLSSKSERPLKTDRSFYVVRESNGDRSLTKISNYLASLVRACDGTRTIDEVLTQLYLDTPEISEELKSYFFVRLLQGAQTQGLISIYRTSQPESGADRSNFD